ncbi:MAG TPA: hypothetical protein PKN11_09555, partial [Anaerolineaceae bacterium]|nr:hypothetical protein [Anaerolineaceae bacterium]
LCAERARSTHAQTCPYAPTAAFCADPPPMSLRGAAEAIPVIFKNGLPRPLRGLAMTDLLTPHSI